MTLAQLENKVSVSWKGYGSYHVVVEYRNRYISYTEHDSQLWDTLKGSSCGYTRKQALQIMYKNCVRANK